METISIILLPPTLLIAAVFTCDFFNVATKGLADKCTAMAEEISKLRTSIEELASIVSESGSMPVPQSVERQEENLPEEEVEEPQRPSGATRIFSRNHNLDDIELACEIVRKAPEDIPERERRFAGLVFTDLEDTYFFDQLMAQNQDLKDTIEASMRKFMSDNMKLEPGRRFYVPNSTFEKYMRTNKY